MGPPVLKKPTVAFVGFGGWSASNRKLYKRAEANGVGVLILRKSFRAPRDRAYVLDNSPRSAAIAVVTEVPSFAQPGCWIGA